MATIILDGVENLWAEEVTIPSGASAAPAVATQGRAIVGVIMPAAWTAANLGYEASIKNVTYNTAYDSGGNLEQTVVAASAFVCIPLADAIFAPFIKIKSVDASNVAVDQAADRTIVLLLKRYLGGQ